MTGQRLGDHQRTPALMFQGTGSGVGKSLLVAGLCRHFANAGFRVRPFKPQNMSNNAAVTADGGEIGRAQALQARAARVPLSVHMNPVLIKPESDTNAQIIVQGRIWGRASASDFMSRRDGLLPKVLESFAEISRDADLVLIEGAGSPAETNLRARDIANMGFAEAADVPVVLIGDIDRGGVIASLSGTVMLLSPSERARLRGFIVNRFRGDARLFDQGLRDIERHAGLPSLGLVPWFTDASRLPPEDALDDMNLRARHNAKTKIAVPMIAHPANVDDLDPLLAEPDVAVHFVRPGEALPGDASLIVLPGSKATIADLQHLRAQGWDIDIAAHVRRGGHVIGLCGGYQMLGRTISDPMGIEGQSGIVAGLGLLDIDTVMTAEKVLREASGHEQVFGTPVAGYEIHIGESSGPGLGLPLINVNGHDDGAISASGQVMGCYLHGLFASDDFRHKLLERLGTSAGSAVRFEANVDAVLDQLGQHLARHLDIGAIKAAAGL